MRPYRFIRKGNKVDSEPFSLKAFLVIIFLIVLGLIIGR